MMESELLTAFLKEKPIVKIERIDDRAIRVYLRGGVYLEFEAHDNSITVTLEAS